jgi:hypothetical protein
VSINSKNKLASGERERERMKTKELRLYGKSDLR